MGCPLCSWPFLMLQVSWCVQPDQVLVVDNRCIYPHTSAFIFAIVAAVTLLVAHILVNTLAGCICQGPNGYGIPYSEKRSLAITYFFLAWYVHISSQPPQNLVCPMLWKKVTSYALGLYACLYRDKIKWSEALPSKACCSLNEDTDFLICYVSWVLANVTTQSSCWSCKCDRNSGHRRLYNGSSKIWDRLL